jgi:Xaa-Pro aminopeptidase
LRIIKDPEEIALIQRAVDITSDAFEQTLPLVVAGAVERDLALEIEFRMKQAGAEELAFDLIVASGPRSSLPHGRAAERRLGQGEFVVFDIGARFKGYHSDMTRTVYLGRPDDKATRIYRTVLESQLLGIESVRPGVTANDVDAAARGYIERTGHAGRFGHGTGHGVGLQIHEAPRVGPRSEEVLRAGMVLTVEPGIYIPGEGGVRIEDIVVVTDTGHRVMTPTRKDRWALE